MDNKHYEVVDLQGRRWATTMTAVKAVRLAEKVFKEKGLVCLVKEISGGK